MKRIEKQTRKELRESLVFQLSTCGYKPIVLGESDCGWDIALTEVHSNGNTWCEFVLRIHRNSNNTVSLLQTYAINGNISGRMIEYLNHIQEKIELVNSMEKTAD